jgi:lysyl-tRNA synthetase class II
MLKLPNKRWFSSSIFSSYFKLSHSINEITSTYSHKVLNSENQTQFKEVEINTGGRIIGRRKASKSLMFLDI